MLTLMLAYSRTCLLYCLERCSYMKKVIIITSLLLSSLLILDSMNVGSALVMFVIAGQVPGTNFSIDAGTMLFFFMLISGIIAGRLTSRAYATLLKIRRQSAQYSRPKAALLAK